MAYTLFNHKLSAIYLEKGSLEKLHHLKTKDGKGGDKSEIIFLIF